MLLQRKDFTSDESYNKYLVEQGFCPECKRKIKGFKPAFGTFAPEIWSVFYDRGIDPATNHLEKCSKRPRY